MFDEYNTENRWKVRQICWYVARLIVKFISAITFGRFLRQKVQETRLSLTNPVTHLCICNGVASLLKHPPHHRRRRHRAGGGTCPPQNLWGTCKKNKNINEKAKYSAKEVFSVSSLATDTLPLINSFVDHTVFYVGADSSQTPQIQFVDILYRSLVNAILNQPLYFVIYWIQVWCTRVDDRKYLNTFRNC